MGETNPSAILREMDVNILEALKQRGEMSANRDGMDMALCSIDVSQKELIFSGASRPLYLVRNSELSEYRGSAYSIGGYLEGKEKIFEDDVVKYQPNDMLYIFSDGYADQFGGENLKDNYNVRTIPSYYLIDREGDLLNSAARKPSEDIESLFKEILKRK